MHFVHPRIHLIASTQVDQEKALYWLKDIGVSDEYELSQGTDAEVLIELAGRRCYKSFEPGINPNVTKIRRSLAAYIKNLMLSRHGSVLEHATYSFAIENVSRVFTAELNRHRAGVAISEGSMRYIRFEDLPVTWVSSLYEIGGEEDKKKVRTQEIFVRAFQQMEENYTKLCELWDIDQQDIGTKKKLTSLFRRIIGLGVATGGVWTFNLRALRHIIATRVMPEAEEEIAYVFSNILAVLSEREPNIFGDFFLNDEGYYMPMNWKI